MSGVAPLSYTTIQAWAELKGIHYLSPLEVEGLVLLDTALFGNIKTKKDEDEENPETALPREYPQWS